MKHQHQDIFADVNNKSCYWAGFIAADGCLKPRNGVLSIGLSSKDKQHLIKFRQALACTNPITYRLNNGYGRNDLQVTAANDLIKSLGLNFNITPRKSLILQPPRLILENYVRAFVRGYMDGDGYISQYGGKNRPNTYIGFAGTREVLQWIKEKIQQCVDVGNPSVYKHKNCNVHQLIFGGRQAERILDWLYIDSTQSTRLDRKYVKYEEIT